MSMKVGDLVKMKRESFLGLGFGVIVYVRSCDHYVWVVFQGFSEKWIEVTDLEVISESR